MWSYRLTNRDYYIFLFYNRRSTTTIGGVQQITEVEKRRRRPGLYEFNKLRTRGQKETQHTRHDRNTATNV